MKTKVTPLVAIAVFAACSAVFAAYSVAEKGQWPDSWPKELEPLREQSRTLIGGILNQTHYEITFTKREDFESAWPHLLKVKSKGAPIILVRSPYTRLGVSRGWWLVHFLGVAGRIREGLMAGNGVGE